MADNRKEMNTIHPENITPKAPCYIFTVKDQKILKEQGIDVETGRRYTIDQLNELGISGSTNSEIAESLGALGINLLAI